MPALRWQGNPDGQARVLVTGVGGNVAQGILKALAAAGIARWVVGTDANPLSVGLYLVDRGYVVPRAGHSEFAGRFSQILRDEKIQLVLVGADEETLHLARLRRRLEAETPARILVSEIDVVERCYDKWLTAQWFAQQKLPHPATVLASDGAGCARLVEAVGFPLVAKPRLGFASRGVVIVRDGVQLSAVAAGMGDSAVIQAYVGNPEEEFTATVFSTCPGEAAAVLVMRRELLQGTSYRIEPVHDLKMEQLVRTWAERLGGIGPVNFQFRLGGQGPVCFEVNARFSGTAGVRYLWGYNDAAMAVEHFVLGQPVRQPLIRPGVVLRYWEELLLPGESLDSLRSSSVAEGMPHRRASSAPARV